VPHLGLGSVGRRFGGDVALRRRRPRARGRRARRRQRHRGARGRAARGARSARGRAGRAAGRRRDRLSEAPLSGILAIDKPEGWTSHDVVAVVRGVLGVRRVGHAGTLDPLATGLLALLVGETTRATERLHTAPKVYDAVVRFGSETATDDREGEPTRSAPPPAGAHAIESALVPLRGAIRQVPPAYAAVKVGGRTAYSRARGGETVELAAREVQVHRLEMTEWRSPDARLLIVCGSGTYVRSIARDLGRALGSAAHLAALRRLAIGALDAADAIGIEALRAAGRDAAVARLRVMDDSVLALPRRYLDGAAAKLVGAGGRT
jgi:tRNA pseudouridine55 synthase